MPNSKYYMCYCPICKVCKYYLTTNHYLIHTTNLFPVFTFISTLLRFPCKIPVLTLCFQSYGLSTLHASYPCN